MKKRLVSLLLTVVMIVSLVPFSAISAFAADATAGTAAALEIALQAASDGDTVTLSADVTDTSKAYTMNPGVTLDLNGHKFAYKSIETKAIGARVIDSAAGEYEIYDYLFTTGRQFIPLGIRPSKLSGADAEMTVDVAVYSTAPNAFMGGHNGSNANRFQIMSTSSSSTNPTMRFWVTHDSDTATNASAGFAAKLGQKFGMSFRLDADRHLTAKYTGALAKDFGTSTYKVFTPDTATETSLNLLNLSQPGGSMYNYSKVTETLSSTESIIAGGEGYTKDQLGRAGWIGKTYSAKIYVDQFSETEQVADLDFIPAKSRTTGMIGMFDKVEAVFYPLLGIVNLASVQDYTALLTLKSNGSFTEKTVIASATGLKTALDNAKSGNTVKIDADITDNTVSYTIPAGVTLDLCGHKFAYKEINANASGSRIIDSAVGDYKLYDYLYTNGTEFITTGVSSLTVSGIKATFTMDQPYPDTGNRHLFGGYYTGGTDRLQFIATDGQSAANKGSATNNTSGIRGGWLCNSAGGAEVAVTANGYKIVNGVESINNLNKKFNVDVHIDANGFSASFSGAHTTSGSITNGLFDRSTKTTQFNMMLLNMSNISYSNMTLVGAQWAGYANDQTGRMGWVGKTYSADIYENEKGGNVTATRSYIPAKASNGAVGMFDKVEGVFYPLLGKVSMSSLSTEQTGVATINKDGGVTIKMLIKTADDLKAALASAKSGDTVKIDAAIDASSDDIALISGVKLDLNGYKLTANSFTATDADALIDNSAESTGRVQVIDTFSCPNGDFAYELDDTKTYKVVESLAHKLSRKDAKHKLAEDFSDTATAYTLAEGVELDLNGHKFSVKSLDAAKGTVIDSTLDILSSAETAKVNCSKGSVIVAESNGFTFAATNPLVVIDNKDNTYNLRKLAVTYLPGSVTGWTLAAPSFDAGTSKYIEYWNYGEKITLAKMVYTADGASISWKQDDKTFTPGAEYATAITKDIEFTTEMKMVEVDSTAYNSWADAVAAIKDNSAVAIYGTVKLTEDLTNATVTYTFGEGGTLDLNGHKFAYKEINANASGSRIIDSATGMYEFYDHITTTGKQFIATGLSIKTGVTGLSAKTMSRRENGSGGWTYFVGTGLDKTEHPAAEKAYYYTNYWFPLAMNSGSGLQARFTYNDTTEGATTPQGSNYPVVNCKDWSSAWNTPAKNMGGINPGDTFTWDYICNTGVQKVSINGTSLLNQTNSKFTYPPVDMPDVNVMLFNRSGAKWSDITQTANYKLFADDADTYDKIGDGTYGRLGWDGDTESAIFYCDPAGTETNTNKVRDFVPAKSVATGTIGMFDMIEGVFYPLLGNVEKASVSNLLSIRIKRTDKTLYTVSASDASELSSVMSGIQSGETAYMLSDIAVSGDVTIPAGATLDLGGHTLSADNVTADSTQSAYIIDHTYEGGVTVSGTFSYGTGHEDYQFVTSDNKAYTITSNWVTRLAKAKSGEIIKLTEMLEDNRDFVLGEGAILDLNGHVLKVKSFDASKGQVIDSTLDIQNSTEAKINLSTGKVIVAEGEEFQFAATNPYFVIDNEDFSYNLRKYAVTYLPGTATGWTLGSAFDASTSKYVEYTTYGETITLAKMVYTADGAYISWVRDGASFTPGAKYATAITEDIEFSTELKLADVDGKAYLSWADAVAAIKNNSSVTIYGNVKLTEDLKNNTVTFILAENATLDLDGHKFAYKTVDAKAIGSRIIDSATGTYEFYDYLFTTGLQYIPLGIRPSELSGAEAELTVDVAVVSNAPNAFLGGHNGGSARFQVISTGYGDSTSMYCWVCDTAGKANANSSPSYKDKLGQKFGMSFRLAADRKITVEYTGALAKAATTSDYTVFTPDTKTETSLNLLNASQPGGSMNSYNNITGTLAAGGGSIIAGEGFTAEELGYRGWIGKTYSAKIYKNQFGTNDTPTLDFVPAKSVATGMIGMFDMVNGEFYPLLGKTESAQMGNLLSVRSKRADKTLYTVSASDASELSSVMSGIQSGETAYMLSDITVSGDVTIPAGVTLDLGGHTLSAANVTADSTQSAFIVDHTFEGKVTVSGTFNYGTGHEDYQFVTENSKDYTIKSNWVTRLKKAQSGEVVKLTESLDDSFDYVLGEGAILDLGGLTMKVKSFDASAGYVTDSLLNEVKNSTSENNDPFSEGKVIADTFKWSKDNTLKVIDNHDGSYSFRKYILQYFPGNANGWTLTEKLGKFSFDQVYKEYYDYGKETTLSPMIYTSYAAGTSGVWAFPGYTSNPGDSCTVTGDMDFTAQFPTSTSSSATSDSGKITIDNTTYYSWDEAAAQIKPNSSVTISGLVKMTKNADDKTVSYTLTEDATLDLNGHSLAYAKVETKAIGARIIDSYSGIYEIYDYLSTNGQQFIPVGFKPSELSGADAELAADAAINSKNPNAFMGGHFGAGTNRFQVMSITYGATTSCGMYCWVSNSTDGSATANSSPVFWNNSGTNKLGEKFGMSFRLDANRKISVKYTGALEKDIATSSYSVINPSTQAELNLNILNSSQSIGDTYAKLTATVKEGGGAVLAGDFTDTEAGYRGWVGKTYSAKLYKNQFSATDPVADLDLVPAKNTKTGMIGMYDKVEKVFYPVLGLVEKAKLGNPVGLWLSAVGDLPAGGCEYTAYGAKIQDGGHCTYFVDAPSFFTDAAFANIESGDTIALGKDITVSKALTIPAGVTLDLCGYDLTVNSLDADQDNTVLKDSSMTNAAVFSSGALLFNKDESTYCYHEVENGVWLCRVLDLCMTEEAFQVQSLNAIARDIITLGADIHCRATNDGYALPSGLALNANGFNIHYYADTPQSLANILSNSNDACIIHLTKDFTEREDFFAIPRGVTVLFDENQFNSQTSKVTKIDGGIIGTSTPASSTEISLTSNLLSSSGIVKLEKDINDNRDYVLGANVILDLNGHNIICNSFDGRNGGVIDSVKNGGHTITVRNTEKTAFRTGDPADTMANLYHYTVSENQATYTFYPYTITYYPGRAGGDPYVQDAMHGQTTLAASSIFSASSDWTFVKWNTAKDFIGDQLKAGSVFNLTNDTILYAQFTKFYYDAGGISYCFDNLEDAMKATVAAGVKELNVVGNTTIKGDLVLQCNLVLKAAYVKLVITGDLDLNGKEIWGNSGNTSLTVQGSIKDSTSGDGLISGTNTFLLEEENANGEFIEVSFPGSATNHTAHRYYSAEDAKYFDTDPENTKLLSGTGEKANQKALVFGLSEYFQSKIGNFLNDRKTKVYVHLELKDTQKPFAFYPDNIKGGVKASKALTKNGPYVVEYDWDITDLLKAEIVKEENKTPENIYALLKNCSGSLEITDSYIFVVHGENDLQSSSLNNLAQ